MKPIALLDTSFLASCLKLQRRGYDIFPALSLLAESVLVPLEIKAEIERINTPEHRPEVINNFLNNLEVVEDGFFKLCTASDLLLLTELETKIDKGEAELLAQAQKVGVYWIWIDDFRAVKKIESSYTDFHFHNIVTIVQLLELRGLLPYPFEEMMEQVQKVYNHNEAKRKEALNRAKKWLQLI